MIINSALSIDPENLATTVKLVPGVIIDAVSILFFKQAEAARQRATEFFNKLSSESHISRATDMAESIEDKNLNSAIKAQIALHMAGLTPSPVNIQGIMGCDK